MREIKFRAWFPEGHWVSGKYGRMIEDYTERNLFEVFGFWDDEIEYMQYTGQVDNVGQPIYEGDILHFPEADEYVDVVFDDGAFRVLFIRDDETTVLTEKLMEANYGVKVIGNVHQNPELIEQP